MIALRFLRLLPGSHLQIFARMLYCFSASIEGCAADAKHFAGQRLIAVGLPEYPHIVMRAHFG